MSVATAATWLWICINPTWAGCGIVQEIDYGSTQACQEALSKIVIGMPANGATDKPVVALCKPQRISN